LDGGFIFISMKKSQFQSIVKEIVRRTINEIKTSSGVEIEVENENSLVIFNLQLEDGRTVSARVAMEGSIENSGIGAYEFWGQKGHDRGTNQWTLVDWTPQAAWDENNTPIDLRNPANKSVIDAINSVVESHREEIETQAGSR